MDKGSLRSKTTPFQKISLIIFGLFIFAILLEIGLRIGGFVLLSLQEWRNQISIKQKGECRIICLGESTTAFGGDNSYPRQLERILNASNAGIKFSVTNKGVAGINTAYILAHLEENINRYNPNMIVTMMGTNDVETHIPYGALSNSHALSSLKQLRIYKLAKLLELHIMSKAVEIKANTLKNPRETDNRIGTKTCVELGEYYIEQRKFVDAEAMFKKALILNVNDDRAYVGLGTLCRIKGNIINAKKLFQKAVDLNPGNSGSYAGLGWIYAQAGDLIRSRQEFETAIRKNPGNDRMYVEMGRCFYLFQKDSSQAEKMFKKAIELNPKNDQAHLELGWCYNLSGDYFKSEDAFKRVIDLNLLEDMAYLGLGIAYRDQGKSEQAEKMFNKVIELNPRNDQGYVELGWNHIDEEKLSDVEVLFNKAIELNPKNDDAYVGLGWYCWQIRKYGEAEKLLKKAEELNPENKRVYGALALLYNEIGNKKMRDAYYSTDNYLNEKHQYLGITAQNYLKLKDILNRRMIKLVCMQYPLRSIVSLKQIFTAENNIIFVDNENIFKDAVAKEGYREYFEDMFAGDFGHCTKKGNHLLAENIAKSILKECFKY